MHNTTWIVVADRGRARIFQDSDPARDPQEVATLVNPAARTRTSEDMTDRLGQTAGSKSAHNTGAAVPGKLYQPAQTPDQHETELFARDVVACLRDAHQQGRFAQLALVAAPAFLGVLRGLLGAQLTALLRVEIAHDVTHEDGRQLRARIDAQLRPH